MTRALRRQLVAKCIYKIVFDAAYDAVYNCSTSIESMAALSYAVNNHPLVVHLKNTGELANINISSNAGDNGIEDRQSASVSLKIDVEYGNASNLQYVLHCIE